MLTNEVKERMENICGATNFSLILRNSEHIARYIQGGEWISLQTTGEGIFKEEFINKMARNQKKYINTIPMVLQPKKQPRQKIYENITHSSFNFEKDKSTLDDHDDDMFNIVLFGPTGCGKSSIINLLFNETVTEASSGAKSVTRAINFTQGRGQFIEVREREEVNKLHYVNVIDTVGLCDSVMSENEVFNLVQDKLKTNLLHIDRVFIVCSGRLETYHQLAIKQFMHWLR